VEDIMTDPRGVGGSGYDLDALSAYADRGRTPAIAAIDDNAECQAVLDSIERLGTMQRAVVDDEAARLPAPDPGWIEELLGSITREVRAGRDIEYPAAAPGTTLAVTEGAIREAVRSAGDSIDGVLVGRVALAVDGENRATVSVAVSVLFDRPLGQVAEAVRGAVHAALLRSTPLTPAAIDVTIEDIHLPTRRERS
jgi:uncharacterized alkaline shock family protein YloU